MSTAPVRRKTRATPLVVLAVVLGVATSSARGHDQAAGGAQTPATPAGDTLRVSGLSAPVEVLRDRWGINHIYAKNEPDLFFAQGYAAARDRLFQFEIWRRQATGTVAEILGPKELKRDIGTRLHMFRGDLKAELNWYHPRGEAIITAFVHGINAYIDEALRTAGRPADRVPDARHHARAVDARGRHLAPQRPARQHRPGAQHGAGRPHSGRRPR